jgi:hypothetical protein
MENIIVNKERLEAAFYEFVEGVYDNPAEYAELIKEQVEDLMSVVISVSTNSESQ